MQARVMYTTRVTWDLTNGRRLGPNKGKNESDQWDVFRTK